ncbi:hypothetical protein PENTCL1PPCAC_6458, partial [Pristionchus entomophagus]
LALQIWWESECPYPSEHHLLSGYHNGRDPSIISLSSTVPSSSFFKVKEFGNEKEVHMQKLNLGTTDLKCKMDHENFIGDKICVPELKDIAVCKGDSDSGLLTTLFRRTFVLGVLSSGTSCIELINERNEALFTDIRLYQATIDKTIG